MEQNLKKFTISMAGKRISITAMHDTIINYCQAYLDEGLPDISVQVCQQDIEFEREKSVREDTLEGIPVRHFSDEYLETLAVYRKIAEAMLGYDTMLFHGSAVAVDGMGYLFTAKSGTGKSTHTRLWREAFGSRAVMVNDDKPLLRITDEGVWVCGTPWDGKHRLSTNVIVPLRGICILERGIGNAINPITAGEALPMLLQQSHRPSNPDNLLKLLDLLDKLVKNVPIYRLKCNMDPEAALVAYHGMQRKLV